MATASARRGLEEKTVTLSAVPNENEWPTVADEVHIPYICLFGGMKKAYFPDKGDFPAYRPTLTGRSG